MSLVQSDPIGSSVRSGRHSLPTLPALPTLATVAAPVMAAGIGLLIGLAVPAGMRTAFAGLVPGHDAAMLPDLGILLGCIALMNLTVQLAAEAVHHRLSALSPGLRLCVLLGAGALAAATVSAVVRCHLPVTPVALLALSAQFGLSGLPGMLKGPAVRRQQVQDWVTAANAALPVLATAVLFVIFAQEGASIGDPCDVVGTLTAFILASGAARTLGDGVAVPPIPKASP